MLSELLRQRGRGDESLVKQGEREANVTELLAKNCLAVARARSKAASMAAELVVAEVTVSELTSPTFCGSQVLAGQQRCFRGTCWTAFLLSACWSLGHRGMRSDRVQPL